MSQSRLAEYQSREEEEDRTAENKFLIWKNELVRGVIDKAQFGKFGLVHTIQELYGSNKAGILLSALSRLFTIFLQVCFVFSFLSFFLLTHFSNLSCLLGEIIHLNLLILFSCMASLVVLMILSSYHIMIFGGKRNLKEMMLVKRPIVIL